MFDLVAEKLENTNYLNQSSLIKKSEEYRNPFIDSVVDCIYLFIDVNPQKAKIVETFSYLDIKI